MPFFDERLGQTIGEILAGEFDMLLGRRTYEIFAATGRTRAATRLRRRSRQGDEIRRHAQSRPTRLEEIAAHQRLMSWTNSPG